MEIHQLRYFCAVARHGAFTQAARAERVAQPSLSQQILKLEDELGAKLFDRLAGGVRLTAYGQAFLPNAQQLLRDLGNAKAEILEMAGQEKGELTVGVIPTIAPYLLPPVLTGFAREHAGIAIKVVEDVTPALLDRLRAGVIDVAVVALPVRGNWIRSVELFWEPMFLVLPAEHRLARREAIRLNEVKGEPFLLLKEGHCFRESAIAACRQARMHPNVVFESGQFATILAMVSAGAGISAVPAMAARPVKGCRYVRIANEKAGRSVGAVTLRRRFETRAQQAFLRHLSRISSTFGGLREPNASWHRPRN
jgi:LysR family transcriptional regulator, hydrogen peroxide-inducible genes activator